MHLVDVSQQCLPGEQPASHAKSRVKDRRFYGRGSLLKVGKHFNTYSIKVMTSSCLIKGCFTTFTTLGSPCNLAVIFVSDIAIALNVQTCRQPRSGRKRCNSTAIGTGPFWCFVHHLYGRIPSERPSLTKYVHASEEHTAHCNLSCAS